MFYSKNLHLNYSIKRVIVIETSRMASRRIEKYFLLRGFICAYHPAAPGSNPKHTIYAFFQFVLDMCWEGNEHKQKRGRDWPIFFKKKKD